MSMRDADRESSEHSRGSTQCPVSTTQSSGGVDVSGVKSGVYSTDVVPINQLIRDITIFTCSFDDQSQFFKTNFFLIICI